MPKKKSAHRLRRPVSPSVQLGTMIILLGLLTVGMVGGLSYLIRQIPSDTAVPKPEVRMVPNTWNMYTNTYGLSLKYPPSWKERVISEYSTQFIPSEKPEKESYMLYVSVIPDAAPGKTKAIFNYDPQYFHQLQSLDVGASTIVGPDPEYFTFQRVEDVTVDGVIARVYRNDHVYNAQNGTVEYRYYIEKGSVTYLLGVVLTVQEEMNAVITPSLFRTILSTVSISL
jgi:hypothetical protein